MGTFGCCPPGYTALKTPEVVTGQALDLMFPWLEHIKLSPGYLYALGIVLVLSHMLHLHSDFGQNMLVFFSGSDYNLS